MKTLRKHVVCFATAVFYGIPPTQPVKFQHSTTVMLFLKIHLTLTDTILSCQEILFMIRTDLCQWEPTHLSSVNVPCAMKCKSCISDRQVLVYYCTGTILLWTNFLSVTSNTLVWGIVRRNTKSLSTVFIKIYLTRFAPLSKSSLFNRYPQCCNVCLTTGETPKLS